MAGVADKDTAPLGAVQQTLFIPLAARARAAQRRRPVLRDPKAVQIAGSVEIDARYGRGAFGWVTVLRTVILDAWVRSFLARNPAGTVAELGTGLNSRFERLDNGLVHWFDLDLPDTIELRRTFFADSGRRRMVAASALDEEWLPIVAHSPGPYFFVTGLARLPGPVRRQLPARYRFLLPLAEPLLGQAMRVALLQA